MPRAKKVIEIIGVHRHRDRLRVDITLSSGERKRVCVCEWSEASAVQWAGKRAAIVQQIAYNLFRWQDWFTREQWDAGAENSPEVMTVGECAELTLKAGKPQTIEVKRSRLKRWGALLDRRLSTLLPMHIEAAAADAKLGGLAPNTQRGIVSALRQALDKAEANGVLTSDQHTRLVKACAAMTPARGKPAIECFTSEEVTRLLGAIHDNYSEWVFNYFEVMFCTGLRPCEARALVWGDIDLQARTLTVRRAKYAGFDEAEPKTPKSRRVVRLNKQAASALARQRALTQLAGGLVFRHPSTGGYIDYHKDHDGVTGRWYEAIEIAGVPRLRPYSTRHTYATTSLMSGVKPGFLCKQLGHDSPQTTFTYYAKWIDGEADAAEADKFVGFVPAPSPLAAKLAGTTPQS